jgi:hypothetical protein
MDGSDPWDWKDESFILDVDSPFVLSESLWEEWTQSEPDTKTLFTSTPSSVVTDPRLPTVDIKNSEGRSEDTINPDHASKGSPRCKRRRMLLFPGDQSESVICDSNPNQQCEESIGLNNSDSHLLGGYQGMQVSDSATTSLWFSANEDPFCTGNETAEKWMLGCINEREGHILSAHELNALLPLTQIPEKEIAVPDFLTSTRTPPLLALHEGKPKLATPVAYPFAVVKPSGVEGDVTLNDINQRISMPPTRPIQHPVGDHAKPPSLASSGSGLSGKAVVALTKIHTEGKGTITIMRTKG